MLPVSLLVIILKSSFLRCNCFYGHYLDFPGKLIISFLIILRYDCFMVSTYINTFICGIKEWHCFRNMSFANFLSIYIQQAFATGSWFGSVYSKFVFQYMLSWSDCFCRADIGFFRSKPVVFMMQPAIFHVKGPAAKTACLGDNNAIGSCI